DIAVIEKLTNRLIELAKDARILEISDISNSHLKIEFNKKIDYYYETGKLHNKGETCNLPAGEIGFDLPHEQDYCVFNGILNIFPGWLTDITELMTLVIKNNQLVDVIGGGHYGKFLCELMTKENFRIVQFGIGTNPNAKDPFSATVADKFIGMAHIKLFPRLITNHFYFPISRMKIDGKTYSRFELFE
ncbi:MAG: hypothetical protein ACTSPI_09765, partial [Candidatus Heimdallarchaeaceae archaeon]